MDEDISARINKVIEAFGTFNNVWWCSSVILRYTKLRIFNMNATCSYIHIKYIYSNIFYIHIKYDGRTKLIQIEYSFSRKDKQCRPLVSHNIWLKLPRDTRKVNWLNTMWQQTEELSRNYCKVNLNSWSRIESDGAILLQYFHLKRSCRCLCILIKSARCNISHILC